MVYRPMNLVVRAGESIQMSCLWENGSNPIDWYHTPVGSSVERKINTKNQIVNAIFNGSTLNGSILGQNLTIISAQKLHAGLYTCTSMVQEEDDLISIEMAAAHVVFLDADPVCQMRSNVVEIEDHIIELCCMLSYTGSLVPKMKWSVANGNNNLKGRELNATSIISQNNVISTLTTVADFTLHGSQFICETVFEIPPTKMNHTVAEKTPNYNYIWKSSYGQVFCRTPPIYIASIAIWLLCTFLLIAIALVVRKCNKGRKKRSYVLRESREIRDEPNGHVIPDERDGSLNNNNHAEYVDLVAEEPRNEASDLTTKQAAENNADHNYETNTKCVGADGTQYVQMNIRPDNDRPATGPVVHHSTIQVSHYASIDHTLKVPIRSK